MRIFISILLFPFFAVSQTTLRGNIFNKTSSDKIPYATVGLMKENIGINTDENGYFILKSKSSKLNDTLIVSSVGFVTQKISITNVLDTIINIQLAEQITTLDEIFVIPNYIWTTSTLNNFSDCGNEFVASSGYLQQVAQHLLAPKENSRLTEVKICRGPGKPKKTIFRIRIYDIDSLTGGPGADLCNQVIEVKSKNNSARVNLEDYKLRISHKDFFVAVEWLKIPENEQDIRHENNNNIPLDYKMYSPIIGWSDLNETKLEAWQLNYSSLWRPLTYSNKGKRSLFISAIIKY
jgi:hypothetical protein